MSNSLPIFSTRQCFILNWMFFNTDLARRQTTKREIKDTIYDTMQRKENAPKGLKGEHGNINDTSN